MDTRKILRWLLNHLDKILVLVGSAAGVAAIVFSWLRELPTYQLLFIVFLVVLGGFGLALWVINNFQTFQKNRRKGIAELSDKEIENTIRDWLDDPAFAFKRQDDPKCLFQFVVTDEQGRPITVSRTKRKPNQLFLTTTITLGTEHRQRYETLNSSEQEKVIYNLRIEMARYGIGYRDIIKRLEHAVLTDVVLLDNALTEFYLKQRIFYVIGAFALYSEVIGQQLMTPI